MKPVTFESNAPDLPALLERVDAHAYAAGWLGRCPAHDDRCPSLSIKAVEDRILLHCFAGCSYEAITAALGGRAWGRIFGLPSTSAVTTLDDRKRREIAAAIWCQAIPAIGTLAETYLWSRAITSVPVSVRFNPSLRHPSGTYLLAMIAAVQGADGKIVGVHRTYLRSDGSGKADIEPQKAALGPIRGGAVRFAKAGDVLALTEGIEDALSFLQATNIPTWAALGTSNLSRVELPDVVREVIIAADGDEPGERAANAAAQRFVGEGRRVRIVRPPAGYIDFNDALQGIA
jgi:putative DNA primase/helicase